MDTLDHENKNYNHYKIIKRRKGRTELVRERAMLFHTPRLLGKIM